MNQKRLLILGANGQLGRALQAKYPDARTADIQELDISDPQSVAAYDWSAIDTILNAAAYTNVDGAETPEGRLTAWQVNAVAVSYLAKAASAHKLTLVHISTDYLFDGIRNPHTEDEPFSPLSVYGASKAAGDLAASTVPNHYILRTSWVIGEGKNFVRTMLEVGAKGVEPKVVNDQIGRLTFTSELVRAIDHLLTHKAEAGTYNVSNSGKPASWAEITRIIFQLAGYHQLSVTDTSTDEYFAGKDNIAPRPLQSTLDLNKIHQTGFESHNWHEDLQKYITSLKDL